MAKNNLEELILSGSTDLTLMAKGFTKDQIDGTRSDIQKKNPNVNVLPDAGESPSGDTSSDSSLNKDYDLSEYSSDLLTHLTTGKPLLSRYLGSIESDGEGNITEKQTELAEGSGEFFSREKIEPDSETSEFFGGSKRVIPGRGKKSTELLTDSFGETLKTLETVNKTADTLLQFGEVMNPLQAMATAYSKDPENPMFRAENLFEVGLSKLIANDEKYQEDLQEKRDEILALENSIKTASQYQTDKAFDPYGPQAEQTLLDKKLELQKFQDGRLQWELQKIAAEAYKQALGDPKLATSDPSKIMAEDTQAWIEHQEKIRKLEPLILNNYGVFVDVNEDGIIGDSKIDIDNDLALMAMQALDLFVYGSGPLQQAGGGGMASEMLRNYTLWSQSTKQELTQGRTTLASSYDQYLDYGEANLDRALVRLRSWVGDALASSPFTIATVAASSLGGPGTGIAAASYLAGVQTFYESMVDPSFDDFYIGGKKLDPHEDIQMALRINDFYRSEGFEILSNEQGTYIDVPLDIDDPSKGYTRVEVDVNDAKRWGYATAKGFAEGVPEGVGASIVLRSARVGGGKHFRDWWSGFYKNLGGGTTTEFLQEASTSGLEILADAAIKGEHLTSNQMIGRVIQGGVTGGLAGGPLQSSLYTYNMSQLTQEQRDALYLQNDFGRIRVVAPGVDIVQLQEKKDRLEDSEITPEEAQVLEKEIKEELERITKNEADLNTLVKRVAETDPSAAVELVAAASELTATNKAVLERKGKNKFVETDALQSEAVGKAEKRFNDALSYAQDVAGSRATAGLSISSEQLSQAQQLQRELVSVEQAAEALGKTVGEVQQFVDNELSTPSTLVVAARLAQNDPSKIKLFETAESYLAAVEEGALAERQGSLAQFMPNGEIHLAPGAAVVDVLEEVLHREIESMGLSQEDIDAMYDEVSKSDNLLAQYITTLRSNQYADSESMKEEVVVGLLREGVNIEFENENLNTLQEKLAKDFAVETFVKSASPVISDVQRYQAIASSHAQASVVDLSRRYGEEELKTLAEEIGLDLSQDLTLDQVEQLTTHAAYNAPVVIQPLNSLIPRELMTPEFEAAVFSNPAVRRDYEDGKVILSVTVRQDGTGVNEFKLRGRNGSVMFSGIEGEQLMAEIVQGQEGTFALSDRAVVSTIQNKLYEPGTGYKEKLEKTGLKVSDYVVINVEQMGPDAIQSGSIISMRRAENMLEVLESEESTAKQKREVINLLTQWLSDIEISTTRTDVITKTSGAGGTTKTSEQFPTREEAREKRRAAKKEIKELAEQVVEGPISRAAERKAARRTTYTEGSYSGTVFFVPGQKVWKSFDQEYLVELYNLRKGNAKQKQEAAEKLLDYLANKDAFETGKNITFENRGKLLGKLDRLTPEGLLIPIEEIKKEARSESLKNFNPEEIKGKIIGTIVGKRKGETAAKFSPPAVKRTEAERESDYGYGIPLEDVSVHTLQNPVSIEEMTGESIGARDKVTRVNIPKPIVDWIGNEAVADKTESIQQGKSSRFMGMPETPFTMMYTEEVFNSSGTYRNQVIREKQFQDGWHFWNWWVLQTGNGKVKELGGWGYMNENGQFVRLGKIPQKKDRNTREVLEVEPLFRNNQQRQIDRNSEQQWKRMIRTETFEAENAQIEQELKEKTEDSNISYGLLLTSASLEYVSLNTFLKADERNHYLKSMSNLFDVMTDSNAMEQGDRIQFSPLMGATPSYQRFADEQFEGMVDAEIASLDVVTTFAREDILNTGKVISFFRDYAGFNDPNIVNSIERTDDGWKLTVNLKVSENNKEAVDKFNASEKPVSRADISAAIASLNAGRQYEARSSKIMPPRYYDLKNDRGAFKGTIDFLNTWMVDKYAEILGLQEQVEKEKGRKVPQSQNFKEIEQLMYGRSRYAMEQLDQKMQAAKQFMTENGITHTDLSQYMYARHAEERNAHIAKKRPDLLNGSGMSNEAAAEVLSKFDTKEMKEAAAMFDAIIDDTRQTMKDYGLETQERLDAWNELYQNYVPLQGFADDEMDAASNPYPTGGAGMAVYGSKVKAAIGRESEAANVLANIVMQNAVTHQWAEKNRVLESLHDLVKKNPMEDVWSIVDAKIPLTKLNENGKQVPMTIMEMQADPHTVPVRINGEQKFIRFQDPYYADVLNGMTMEQTNTFLRMMRAPVSWLRGVFTQWDPNFFVSNFARDIGGSLYTASSDLDAGIIDNVNTKGFQKKMFGNTFRSLNALLGEAVRGKELPAELQQFYNEWKEDGGQTGWNYVKDLKEIEAELAVNADDLTRGKQLRDKLFSSPKKFFEFVEGVNDAFENSIRLSAYMTARQQGASRQQAAVFSKNITVNFNKQGEAGPAINTMYLFFNAAIQGNKRVYESITRVKPPVKPDGSTREWYERATGAQKIAAGMAGFSGMLTLLNIAMSGRDPEDDELWYNKVSEYDKQRNMIICYGPERDDFLKIPLPYGFGLFNNMGLALAETSTGNRSADEALLFLGTSAFSAFSPISFGGDADNPGTFVLRSFAPTTLKPFVELAENRTYFGSPITGEQLPFGTPVPSSELSFRAPQEIQTFFEWMNQATGGSQFKSGWADFNPDYSWYLFEYFVGGSGDFILSTGEQARNIMEMSKRSLEKAQESKDVGELIKALGYGFSEEGEVKINYNDIPIAKKIYGEASPFYDIEAFKDNSMEIEQLFREIKEEAIVPEPGRYKGVQALHKEYQETNKTLKKLREALREAREIEDYIDRQNRIFDLYEAQRRVMARYNKKYKELRGED